MSEVISFASGDVTIYGSIEGARVYLGPEYEEWDLSGDGDVTTDMRRALVKARRFLDGMPWAAAYDTFAARDALDLGTGGGDAAFPFRAASYELAAMVLEDDQALVLLDDLRGVTSVSAGGDSISFGSGTTNPIPGRAYLFLAAYLIDTNVDPVSAELDGKAGGEVNPFSIGPAFELETKWRF